MDKEQFEIFNEFELKFINFFFPFILICGLLGLIIWEQHETRHDIQFEFDSKYKVNLYADECLMCAFVWQIDYTMEIEDLEYSKKCKFKFLTTNGPNLEFGV